MTTAPAAAPVVKERPILFSAPMVVALLAGTKTQTRRIVKPQPPSSWDPQPECVDIHGYNRDGDLDPEIFLGRGFCNDEGLEGRVCPYGWPGERLWVRETHAVHSKPCEGQGIGYTLQYRADNAERELDADTSVSPTFDRFPHQKIADEGWKPSIHMPRWACRIVLEITEVRVERLQAISEGDASAEGVPMIAPWPSARARFMDLWDLINGQASRLANPWVWALTFKRVAP